jgi:cell division protein ZapD
VPTYDYPCNERIRIMLRLEDLFAKLQFFSSAEHEFHHHAALLTLFQVLELIDRSDLKSDLLQELDRQKLLMETLRGNPVIAEDTLQNLLQDISEAIVGLRSMTGRIGQPLRENDWLMAVKQRAVIPGGACEFDVPSYHFWLGLPAETRQIDLQSWMEHLRPLETALRVILHILRGSGAPMVCQASQGGYQQMLSGAKPSQMLRVSLPEDTTCFPEISANKYAINIRFNSYEGTQKARGCDQDFEFQLALCNL